MRTTIQLPDDLFRRTKATAALNGESLKDFVAAAIAERLGRQGTALPERAGWRSVFGQASREHVREVDEAVAADLGTVDPDAWT